MLRCQHRRVLDFSNCRFYRKTPVRKILSSSSTLTVTVSVCFLPVTYWQNSLYRHTYTVLMKQSVDNFEMRKFVYSQNVFLVIHTMTQVLIQRTLFLSHHFPSLPIFRSKLVFLNSEDFKKLLCMCPSPHYHKDQNKSYLRPLSHA